MVCEVRAMPLAPEGAPPSDGTALQVAVTDAGAAVAGLVRVSEYAGPVPSPPAGSVTISQMPGWPITIGGDVTFAPSRGLAFTDLDRDGRLDIVVSSTDKKVYAWDVTGALLPGFPVTTIEKGQTAPSVADLDGDGDIEIVQFTRGLTSGGRFYILDHQGNPLPGFPKSLNNNNVDGSPALADLDDDGFLEVLVPERAYPIGYLHVFEVDGSEWGGQWPVALDHVPTGTSAVGDLDADGALEIVHLSYTSLYVLETDGTPLAGWPKQIPNANFSYQSPALADLDGDGDLEIVVGAHQSAAGCYVFHHTGEPVPGWPRLFQTWSYCAPTVADLERDGELDILDGQAGGVSPPSNCFWAWTASGVVKSGFPYVRAGGSEGPLTIVDLDNDGAMEILADSNLAQSNQGYLYGVDTDGSDLPGFPLRPQGFTYMNGATIGDVDGDGDYELGVVSFLDTTVWVNLYDLPGAYHASDIPWETYHQRMRRGGVLGGEDRLHVRGVFAIGGGVSFLLHDAPGSKAFLLASPQTDLRSFPPLGGWLYLKKSTWRQLAVNQTIPESGEFVFEAGIPNRPSLVGRTFFIQGVTGADPLGGVGAFTNMLGRTVQ